MAFAWWFFLNGECCRCGGENLDSFSFQLGPIINISIFFSFVRFCFLVILGYTGTKVAGQNLRDTLCAANRKPLGTDVHHSAPKVTGLLSGSLTLSYPSTFLSSFFKGDLWPVLLPHVLEAHNFLFCFHEGSQLSSFESWRRPKAVTLLILLFVCLTTLE